MKSTIVTFVQFVRLIMGRLRIFLVILLAAGLLSGCVNYDVGVNFEGVHRGKFVQHIKLEERLTNFSSTQVQDWLKSIERRAKQLNGKTKRISNQEIVVTIPFSNGKELESKFNQFFNPITPKNTAAKDKTALDLPKFDSKVHLNQGNFIFWQRTQLSYDLDLRSLGVVSNNGNVVVSPGSLLDLRFSLETPWGASSIENTENAIAPEVDHQGHTLLWTLKPGQINHLEAVFWLPSPLGIGTLLIVLAVLGGYYWKYKAFPWVATPSVASASVSKA